MIDSVREGDKDDHFGIEREANGQSSVCLPDAKTSLRSARSINLFDKLRETIDAHNRARVVTITWLCS
jgi:hypothetical protein